MGRFGWHVRQCRLCMTSCVRIHTECTYDQHKYSAYMLKETTTTYTNKDLRSLTIYLLQYSKTSSVLSQTV